MRDGLISSLIPRYRHVFRPRLPARLAGDDSVDVFPIVSALGYDPVWFGIIIVMVVELGLITPPIGMNVFVIKGIAREVPLYTIFRGVTPFIVAQIILIAVLIAFPEIALWLPSTMQ